MPGRILALCVLFWLTLSPVQSGETITAPEAREAAQALVGQIAAYSAYEPTAASAMPEWTTGEAGQPLLVHGYGAERGSYYLVPVSRRGGTVDSVVSIDARTGRWQSYRRIAPADRLFPVTAERAREALRRRFGLVIPAQALKLVMMPNKRLYWHLERAESGVDDEYFVDVRDAGEIISGADRDETGLTAASPPICLEEELARARESEVQGGRFPASHEIAAVPHHYQITPYYCCPASVEMVFDYWGPDVDQTDIAHVSNTNEIIGTTSSDMRRSSHFSYISTAFQDPTLHGYDERPIGYGSLENRWSDPDEVSDPDFPDRYSDLKTLISSGYPVMIATWYDATHQEGHQRVLKGYNDDTEVFIVHDAWDGPDQFFNQAFLVDDLWTQNRRWALLSAPWSVEVTAPLTVCAGTEFDVDSTIVYRGPHPFEGQYEAANAEATISLPIGFTLATAETATKEASAIDFSGSSDVVTWKVVALAGADEGTATVDAEGMVAGSSISYPTYSDWIGGSGGATLTAVSAAGKTEGLSLWADKSTIECTPVTEVSGYDVVKGDLGLLRSSGGDFAASTTACLESDSADCEASDTDVPAVGEGFYYLARAVNACGPGSYDTDGAAQVGFRDTETAASGNDCP